MTCMMEQLANPNTGTNPTAIVTLLQTPLRDPNYTTWVDSYRNQNITLIAMDALDYMWYLSWGYVDGLVGQIVHQMGILSAQVLSDVAIRGIGEPNGVVMPEDDLFAVQLVAYNKIPVELDKKFPPEMSSIWSEI